MSFEDFEGMTVKDGFLIIRVKADKSPNKSSSGKTYILYKTGKAKQMEDDSYVQLTWYKYPPRT